MIATELRGEVNHRISLHPVLKFNIFNQHIVEQDKHFQQIRFMLPKTVIHRKGEGEVSRAICKPLYARLQPELRFMKKPFEKQKILVC